MFSYPAGKRYTNRWLRAGPGLHGLLRATALAGAASLRRDWTTAACSEDAEAICAAWEHVFGQLGPTAAREDIETVVTVEHPPESPDVCCAWDMAQRANGLFSLSRVRQFVARVPFSKGAWCNFLNMSLQRFCSRRFVDHIPFRKRRA